MYRFFVVWKPEKIKVRSLFYESGRRDNSMYCYCFRAGDTLEVTNRGIFVPEEGWYIMLNVNGAEKMYVPFKQLEQMSQNETLQSIAELAAEISLLPYLMDYALDHRDEQMFNELLAKWTEIKAFRRQLFNTGTYNQ